MAESTPVKPEITKVASLTSDSCGERWKISVKVKSKSEKTCSKTGTDYFKVVLEDDSGQIEALAFGSQNLHRFFDKFEENKVYLISDGKLTKVNENFPNVGHPFQIFLESGTIVTCDDGEDQPSSPFTPIAQLKTSNKTIVDIVGIVTGVWKLEKKYTDYRAINLTDENGFDVNVALWGKLATAFDVNTMSSVVSLKNVRVKKENGEVELQSTLKTELDYKPPDAEAVVLREILGLAEDNNDETKESDDMRNLDEDASLCSGCHRKRGSSNTGVGYRKRNDSGTSNGRGKCNRNNLGNDAVCRRRGSGSGRGKRGRKKYSTDQVRNGRGRGRRKSDTTCSPGCFDDNYDYDGVPNEHDMSDDFINDGAESDVEDSEVDDLGEYRRKRLPVRHCKSLYSDFKEDAGTRKSTTSVADDDDDDDETEDDNDDDDDDSDENKKDSDEKSGKKNQRRGRPSKRRLFKDQKDGKTSPGKLTRLRKKSTPGSAKKSSQSQQEAASSSQGPVTKISIQTDDESDVDAADIKPVSSTKKVRKVESSDSEDTDSTVSYSPSKSREATPGSSGKRKSCRSDDDDDDDGKNKSDDDDEDDEKDLTESAKKKFKRIKTACTSSQETVQSVEPDSQEGVDKENVDDGDSSGSDTHSYHSEPDNTDDQWVEEDPQNDRAYIQKLREIQKDDDGTLYLLRHYILWFAMKAGGEICDGEDFQETVDSKIKLEGRLEVVMNICQSQAWSVNFREDVRAYPKFVDDVKHDDLAGGDMRLLGNCEVCNRENHPWSVIVRLEGEPYNRETYEMVDKEEGEDCVDFPPVKYYMGCFCHPRTKLFHNLFHFGYNLYHRCKEMLEDGGSGIDAVATDKSLLNEMYTKLKKWMLEAENDYTEDGERANNRWNREYNGEGGNWLRFNF